MLSKKARVGLFIINAVLLLLMVILMVVGTVLS